MKIILETERLLLREITPEDAENAYLLNMDPEVLQYTGDEPFADIEEARTFLTNYDHYRVYGFGRWGVIHKGSGEFLGWCGLKYTPEDDEFDVGFRLSKRYWNHGYASEAAKACMEYGFKKLGIKTIVGRAMKANLASVRVLEKCGLTYQADFDFDGNEGVIYSISSGMKEPYLNAKKLPGDQVPAFEIQGGKVLSDIFLKLQLPDFKQAVDFVNDLPYGRNADKDDPLCLFADARGTCSTKHAALKRLASENGFEEIQLCLGIFKMNEKNTPAVSEVLKKYGLEYIPEAHNYLKLDNKVLDITWPLIQTDNFVADLLDETVIEPEQITGYKVLYHKKFLEKWLSEHPEIHYSPSEIWDIREECIRALADFYGA